MRNILLVVIVLCLGPVTGYGQGKYLSNDGKISFFSHAPLEDIEAIHHEVSGVIDAETGEVVIIVRMTGFQFEKKLMQEHFNENYVESDRYPKSTFEGRISNNEEVDYSTEGSYPVKVEGSLHIHGVSRDISVEGQIEVRERGIIATTEFIVRPADYKIRIPKVVRKNIAEEVKIDVKLDAIPI